MLIATSLASLGAYSYFRGLNAQFIQGEVTHRSELLLHDIREIIQQHIDATQGLSAYVYSELASHHGIDELDEAELLLRGTIAAHPDELVQAAIFPPDTFSAVSYADPDAQAPPIVWSDLPKLTPGIQQLVTVQSGQGHLLLRVLQSICVQETCGYTVADLNTYSLIRHTLETASKSNLDINLYVKVDLVANNDEMALYVHSASPQSNVSTTWRGSFELAGSRFTIHTTAPSQLIQHLSSETADWVLALGLILGLLLTHLAYNRARYGEQLRDKVAERTQKLTDEQQKLAAVIDNADETILVANDRGKILRANPAACELFGYTPEEWNERTFHDLVPSMFRGQHQQQAEEEIKGPPHKVIGHLREISAQKKDGSVFSCEVTVNVFMEGEEKRISIILRDFTERKKFEEKLTWFSYYDELTELPNRRLFSDRVEQAIALEIRQKRQLAVIYMGLSRFRMINDALGHSMGDQVLKEAARRLQEVLRKSDTLARMGSNIFTVLLPETEVNTATKIAKKIRQAMEKTFYAHEQEISLGTNIGIAVFPDDGENAETLIRHAASAMTHAKRDQSAIHYYSSTMESKTMRRLHMEHELARAADANQFELHYQAKHQLTDGAVFSLESLIRWHHPELGMVSPAEFIPLAEETGLIRPITRWVLDESARQAIIWEKAGIRPGRVSVNISAVHLMQKGLAEKILSRIKNTGAKTEWIEVEITETAAMREPETAIQIMRKLVDAGISIAIDDFGTGYSSLAYLKRLPAETLKIDIAFIRGLPNDEEDAAIVRSIIVMAHALGKKVIAEGVETKEQLEFLREEGCDAVQGYYFSKPLPADQAMAHIKNNPKSQGT